MARKPFTRQTMLTFRPAGRLFDAIRSRMGTAGAANESQVASRDLGRYYALLESELAALSRLDAQAGTAQPHAMILLCQALHKLPPIDPRSIRLLPGMVRAELDKTQDSDVRDVLSQTAYSLLDRLSDGTLLALLDAAERAWALPEGTPWPERVRQVGLAAPSLPVEVASTARGSSSATVSKKGSRKAASSTASNGRKG